jgi:hypothetical protein
MTGRVRLDDLPAAVRARVVAQAHPVDERATIARKERATSAAGGLRWRCHRCGATFSAWAPAERHANGEHGGGRVELLLDDVRCENEDRGRGTGGAGGDQVAPDRPG